MNVNDEELAILLDRHVLGRETLPLIVGEWCYEHFGERVKIVEVNMYDEVENAEVLIESSSCLLYTSPSPRD